MKTGRNAIGSPGGLPLPAPTPPDMRVRVRRFLAVLTDEAALFLCHNDRCPVARPVGFIAPAQDHRWSCLPAKFSPSRVVSPSSLPGSLLPVLRPLLTPVPARQPLLATAPTVADRAGRQVSLSKDVNSCCTTGPFISGAEHGAALCGASWPAPSTLYGLSVRRLISFD